MNRVTRNCKLQNLLSFSPIFFLLLQILCADDSPRTALDEIVSSSTDTGNDGFLKGFRKDLIVLTEGIWKCKKISLVL